MSETGEFFEGFVDDYFAECEEHLTGAARALLALEEAMGDPPAERAAIDELRAKAANAAAAAARSLIAEQHDAAADEKLVNQVIGGL